MKSTIKGSGKKSATFVIAAVSSIALAILFLNACGARHEERTTAGNPANNQTPRPNDTQIVTPAMSPTPTNAAPTNAAPRASTEETVAKSPRLVPSASTPTPTQTLPGPGTGNGMGSGTGNGIGPGSGGGTGINPNPRHGNPADIDYNRIFTSREVDQRARITEKPEPGYTEAARAKDITGTVVLSAVLAASGQVMDIKVIHGLPDGLNEKAIAAARRIKFTPALIYGRPVSMHVQLEYNFNFY